MERKIIKNNNVKFLILALGMILGIQGVFAQQQITSEEKTKQELINLSKTKWRR